MEETTIETIKQLIADIAADRLDGVQLEDNEPILAGRICLDSVNSMELIVAVEEQFGIEIPDAVLGPELFESPYRMAEEVIRLIR